jgi:FkbH-like protein
MKRSALDIGQEIEENFARFGENRQITIQISGSVYLGLTDVFLRLLASRKGVRLTVRQGNYDNPLEDLVKLNSDDSPNSIVLVPFFDSITTSLEARHNEFSDDDIENLLSSFVLRWRQILQSTPSNTKVLVLGLHSVSSLYPFGLSRSRRILDKFNSELRDIVRERIGTIFVDMEALILNVGIRNAIDSRMYFKARNPYSVEFAEVLAEALFDALSIEDSVAKVIALDCDNTLWGGILGEDGFSGIRLDPNTAIGAVYHEAQHRLKELKDLGMLLCLVSKNDENDVLQVLEQHEHQVLRPQDVISHRINWKQKSSNLSSLAEELNLGLSSFIFIDDSSFECAEVQEAHPEMTVLQFPDTPSEVLRFLSHLKQKCLSGRDEVNVNKTAEYRVREEIESAKSMSGSSEIFLESLDVRAKIEINQLADVSRLAEMCSKTNQFNTTTKRRTAEELRSLMTQQNCKVVSVRLGDRFANHGLTALMVLMSENDKVRVTDFLMSCRVLGRNIEHALIAYVADVATHENLLRVDVDFVPSSKNGPAFDALKSMFPELSTERGEFSAFVHTLIDLKPSWVSIDQ